MKWYGESEFWLALGKVILIIGLIIYTYVHNNSLFPVAPQWPALIPYLSSVRAVPPSPSRKPKTKNPGGILKKIFISNTKLISPNHLPPAS